MLNNLDKDRMKRAKHIEDRNQVLVQNVRKNIEKIDKIVNRLAIPAPMAFSRVIARTSSMTDPNGESSVTQQTLTTNDLLTDPTQK